MADRTHITFALSTTALTALLIAAGMLAQNASAQTAPEGLAKQASYSTAQAHQASSTAPAFGDRWETADCRTGAGVEVAPISFDVMNAPEEWAIIERANGQPVSAQRIDPSDTTLIKSIQCGDKAWLKPQGGAAGS